MGKGWELYETLQKISKLGDEKKDLIFSPNPGRPQIQRMIAEKDAELDKAGGELATLVINLYSR